MAKFIFGLFLVFPLGLWAQSQDYLIKLTSQAKVSKFMTFASSSQVKTELLGVENWVRISVPKGQVQLFSFQALSQHPDVEYIQPNYKIHLLDSYKATNPLALAALKIMDDSPFPMPQPIVDNPEIPVPGVQGTGADPEFVNQWGMQDINVQQAWSITKGRPEMIVAVIDTGVDYTHEDLVANIWRNKGETGLDANGRNKETNGVDDDNNGYVDDIIGWDFASNDNKPFDLTTDIFQMLLGGGNPGHGTHCAGNVGARGGNGIGISGVAQTITIMPLRFITEKGQGTTADAIKAIKYAVDNGAKVLSNSWGSEGEDPSDTVGNKALRDAIRYAQEKGVLFIAAAGNGHSGRGYDNDTDPKPAYPASYDMENIISVAALDVNDNLGSFSNWGRRTVDLGAPGVRIFSTVPGNKYTDVVLSFFGQVIYWDGTSMATPHVAGAAGLYWSKDMSMDWRQVKRALLNSVRRIPTLANKTVSGGKLDVDFLLRY